MVNAIFFDRDGVLSELAKHGDTWTAPWSINEFKLCEKAIEACQVAKQLGFSLFVVTNQPDVYDNKLPYEDLVSMNKILEQIGIDATMNALERNTAYYKPNTLMVETLTEAFDVSISNSYMIGDTWKDVVCGKRAQLFTILIGDRYNCPDEYIQYQPDLICSDVLEACLKIKERLHDKAVC